VYGLVVNLGSLVVRTAFQPFEEAAFTSFSTSGDSGALCWLFTCDVHWLWQKHYYHVLCACLMTVA
jgi:desulfoferrodoxin (superoxide reductase-like protein)